MLRNTDILLNQVQGNVTDYKISSFQFAIQFLFVIFISDMIRFIEKFIDYV